MEEVEGQHQGPGDPASGSIPSFEDVRDLPEARLRALLASATPVERVWAAWALALRLGPASAPAVERSARSDPDPGLRRHLVVLLAGFGEREAVSALAWSDPDPHVRASACQLLTRLAAADPALWPQVRARFGDPDAIVREALVVQLPAAAPPDIRAVGLAGVDDGSPSVRQAVAERLSALLGDGAPVPEQYAARTSREPDPDLRRLMLACWRAHAGSASFLSAVARAGEPKLAQEALDVVEAEDPEVSWAALQAMASLGDQSVQERLVALLEDRLESVPLAWLVQLASTGPRWRMFQIGEQLCSRLASSTPRSEPARAELLAIATELSRLLDSTRDPADPYEDRDWGAWRSSLREQLSEASRHLREA